MTIRQPPKLLQTVWGVGYRLNAVTGSITDALQGGL